MRNRTSAQIEIGMEHVYGGLTSPFVVSVDSLLRHVWMIGRTGVGKSTAMLNVVTQLIEAGEGCAFLDPHGMGAIELLDRIPRRRTRDVVYFNPQDTRYPIGINPLDGIDPEAHHLVASGLVEAMRNIEVHSWGPRLDWILYNSARALLEAPNTTLLDVMRLLVDEDFRIRVLRHVRAESTRSFWFDEFGGYDRSFRSQAIAPVQNKVGKLRAHTPLRNVLGQKRSTIDLDFMLDNQRVLVVNLAGIGTDSANLLGSLLNTLIQGAAIKRGGSTEPPTPFTLIMDECQRFTTESISVILSESRKYGLGVVMGNQFLEQLTESIRNALFGNAGTMIAFGVGGLDSHTLSRHCAEEFPPKAFVDLPRFRAIISAERDGSVDVFQCEMNPPIGRFYGRGEVIASETRRRFAGKAY